MSSTGPILVTGATGAQGGAVVEALLQAGASVRALARDPGSAGARALAARGVELKPGDWNDPASLAAAMRGAGGVFSVQRPPSPADPESELRHGRHLVDAARAAGVEVFVHTSVARADEQARFVGWAEGRWSRDYWNSKSGVNDMVRAAGFPRWVILKPAFMMDNFIPPKAAGMFPSLVRGAIDTAMTPQTRLDLIAASDIGRIAAAAFADPARFAGEEIGLAAEALTMAQTAEIISEATGKPVVARSLSPDEAVAAGVNPGFVSSQEWASVEGYKVDIARANSFGIALESFADWARRHRSDFDIRSSQAV